MRSGAAELSLKTGLQTADINIVLKNLNPDIEIFKKGQVIMSPSSNHDSLGLVLRGTVFLEGENEAADRRIVDYFEIGEIFGIHMLPSLEETVCYAVSKRPCTVAFINYHELLEYCAANQSDTVCIMDYLFSGLERKALAHAYILQQRTLREKILLYFSCLRQEYGADHFTLPMPFTDLADYLSADRSALMREVKKLNDEGIIQSDRRKIILPASKKTDFFP